MYETLIKRTVFTAKCKCGGLDDVRTSTPPRERQCPACSEWVKFEEISAVGPDFKHKK